MKQFNSKEITTYTVIFLLFVALSYAFFAPQLSGKVVDAHDTNTANGGAKEIADFRAKTGEEPLWTNSLFGGMPSYLISTYYKSNLLTQAQKYLYLGNAPASWLILNFAGFFVLLLVMGVSPWLSFGGAIAYGLSSYFLIIINAGHNTKADTMAFMAFLLAGILMTLKNKNKIGGAIVTALSLSCMIRANHPQITYYTMIMVMVMGIYYLVDAYKNKTLLDFSKSIGILVVAVLLVVASDYSRLSTTMEYGKYSIRGKSDLTPKPNQNNDATTGLDRPYITAWSYGIDETLTLMIPNFRGGGSADEMSSTDFYKKVFPLIKQQIMQSGVGAKDADMQANQSIGGYYYWGDQPGTSGPLYYGAIIMFLFVLGLFVVKGKEKYWLLTATLLSITIGWGQNFPIISNLFIDYFPGFNKFRTISMTFVIAQLTIPLLGMLALKEVLENGIDKNKMWKSIYYAGGITGGLSLIFFIIPSLAGGFAGSADSSLPAELKSVLIESRISALRMDAFRSFAFIAAAIAVIYFFIKGQVKILHASLAFSLLFLLDMWPIAKRYLNEDDFVAKQTAKAVFTPSKADIEILRDTDKNYRVLNIATSTFNDATTSYFHKSIGGYHGAKMKRYQEVIENNIGFEMQNMVEGFKSGKVAEGLQGMVALNMLNTKYIIYNPEAAPILNPFALGNAWMVDEVKVVENADQELATLKTINPRKTAVINKKFSTQITGISAQADSMASVILQSYAPNKLVYQANTNTSKLAVFSEIYYPAGWVATIDGKSAEIVNVNYVLRGLVIPQGNHTVVFEFKPKSYFVGNKISFAGSLTIILFVFGYLGYLFVQSRKQE